MLVLGLLLAGCAAPCVLDERGRIEVVAAPDANRGSAVAVDLVAANDRALADQLAGLDATQWFVRRAQLERDNPGTLTVTGWELAPGQRVGPEEVRFPCGPRGIFAFASLRAPGEHRVRLRRLSRLTIEVGPDAMVVSP